MDKSACPTGRRCRSPASVCFVVGFLFGLPALRLEGLYLALATFALARRRAAAPQVQAHRALDRRRAGHRAHQARPALRPAAQPRDQWLYFFTLAVAVADVPARLEPAARPRRAARWWRSATTRSPPQAMGINPPLLQVADLRRLGRLYTGVAGALRRHRHRVRGARQLHRLPVDHRCWSASWSAAWPRSPGAIFGAHLHPVRAEHRRRDLQVGAVRPSTACS